MEICPQCRTPYGKRRRCYVCTPGRQQTGMWISCQRADCDRTRYVQQNQLKNEACRFCSDECKQLDQKGHVIPWMAVKDLGYARQRTDGYVEVKVGTDVSRSGYELEHRLMMALLLGRPLGSSDEVHHGDLDRSHNCPGNLSVIPNGEHQELHHVEHPQPSTKIAVTCALSGCEHVKLVVPSHLKAYQNVYCSNEHRLEGMHEKARAYHAEQRSGKATKKVGG